MIRPRIAIGMKVTTPFGTGVVTGFDQRTTFEFGNPKKQTWLVVAIDSHPGQMRWVLPDQAELLP